MAIQRTQLNFIQKLFDSIHQSFSHVLINSTLAVSVSILCSQYFLAFPSAGIFHAAENSLNENFKINYAAKDCSSKFIKICCC